MRAWLLASLALAGARPAPPERPNVVFILADDLGWTDLGCFGSDFYETPHLDRLASRGMKFTQAYSACTVCSPTRASLLTGKYPARLRVTDWIPGHVRPAARLRVPDWTQQLPLEEATLAERLKEAGYATASIGKWHLGGEAHLPERHGFDRNVAGTHRGQPPSYFSPYKIPTLKDGPAGEYVTDRLTDAALSFIEEHRAKPFFLYLPHFAVHTPLQAPKEKVEKYRAKAKAGAGQSNAVYAAMVESLDESVGRIAAKLEALGISEKTLLVFTSDNGGLLRITSNAPLRAGKGSAYEGGVRVPLIVAWPGTVPAGTCAAPVITPDWYPTILELAGLKAGETDGVSLAGLLQGKEAPAREDLFWHYPHYHPGGATPYGAVRSGNERLVEFYEDDRVELYDLGADPGETKDLAAERPERAKELRRRLQGWRAKVGAQMPTANPEFKPGGK